MMDMKEHTTPHSIFDKLSNMVASCIMQDSVRHDIKGMPIRRFANRMVYSALKQEQLNTSFHNTWII